MASIQSKPGRIVFISNPYICVPSLPDEPSDAAIIRARHGHFNHWLALLAAHHLSPCAIHDAVRICVRPIPYVYIAKNHHS